MTQERLLDLFSRFASLKIAVAGDLFLDRWYEMDPTLDEASLETGLTAWQVVRKRSAAGAAGTVPNNLSGLGVGHLKAISMVGEDGDGWELLRHLQQLGIDTQDVIISPDIVTPSYIKPLFPEEGNRLDIKNFRPTPEDLQQELIRRIASALDRCDALILLDQVCEADTGVLTSQVRQAVCDLARQYPDKLVYADSRAFIHQFRDVVIKCNNREAAQISGYQSDDAVFDPRQVFDNMERLQEKTHRPVIITCNRHGIAVMEQNKPLLVRAAKQTGPIDVCGAGDACTAGLVSALCAGAGYGEAAFLGNLSAGVTVRQLGQTGRATQQAVLALYNEQWGEDGRMEPCYLALDVGGSKYIVGLITRSGQVVESRRGEWTALTQDCVLQTLVQESRALLAQTGCQPVACGITIPGLADPDRGLWVEASFSGIRDFAICQQLEQALGIPAYCDNDGQAFALAEMLFGSCQGVKDFIYMNVSNGIGGALVSGGRLIYGSTGSACEPGHCCVVPEGRLCKCGNQGCLERYAAGPGLALTYQEAGGKPGPDGQPAQARLIAQRAREGEALARKVFVEEGRWLGIVLAMEINLLNPQKVILGGGIAMAYDLFGPSLEETVRRHVYRTANPNYTIQPTPLGYLAGLYGAAAIAVYRTEQKTSEV